MLGTRQSLGAADSVGVRPDAARPAPLERAFVQLHVVPDAEPADHVEQLLERDPLGVEQQLLAGIRIRRSPSILPFGVRNAA